MAEKMRPCPFCGGTKDLESYQVTPGWTNPYWRIGCAGCGCWFEIAGWTEDDAIAAWNTREDGEHNDEN